MRVSALAHDRDRIIRAIQLNYRNLALSQNKHLQINSGYEHAHMLKYPKLQLEAIPVEAVRAFTGVGNPFVIESLKRGWCLVDIGSGAGMDACIASHLLGHTGKIYGIEMNVEMLELARKNARKIRAGQVTFLKGFAESIPLPREMADIVISNGAINLCLDKMEVYKNVYRILRVGGRIQIADTLLNHDYPITKKKFIDHWANCLAGGVRQELYFDILNRVGFKNIRFSQSMDCFGDSVLKDKALKYGAVGGHIYAEK